MDSLETERLLIRPWRTMDAQDYFSYAKSPVMAQQLALRPITTDAEAKKVVADFIKGQETWAIELKSERKVIGHIGLHSPKHNEVPNDIEMDFAIAQPYQNRGYATEAVKEVAKYAFEYYMVRSVLSYHLEGTLAAKRVFEKAGFRYNKLYEYFYPRFDKVKISAEVYLLTLVDYEKNYKR